jgi:flagellar biosynthesis/type III secretory pathway protein FliH
VKVTKNIIDTSEFMAWNPGSHQPEFKTPAGNKERKTSNSNDSDSPENAKVVEQDLIDSSESERLIAEYEKGFIEGEKSAEKNLSKKIKNVNRLLLNLNEGHCDLSEFYLPLKSLTIRIVEAVLKAELVESRKGVEKIVEDVINSLGSLSNDPVKLALGEEDYYELTEEMRQEFPLVQFILDQKLSQGSAYGRMNDKTINDLSEERLADIVNKVLSNG